MTGQKFIYLPLDVKVRELHSKMLFAAAAAARGYKVIIGRKKEVDKCLNFYPPGIYLGLGAQKNFLELYQKLEANGSIPTAMDEEGLVTFDDTIYRNLRIFPASLARLNPFFTWGRKQSAVVAASDGATADKLKQVGNLRLDTLRPEFRGLWEKDLHYIRQRYGRYVLIVSSFGSANHFDGDDKFFQSLIDKKILQTPEDENLYRRYIAFKKANLAAFLELVPDLARQHPDIIFIVRPHPSESHGGWSTLAETYPNVRLESDLSIQPWIIGAEMVLHHFCTTAIEAMLTDTPAVAFRAICDDTIESRLPYLCSIETFSREEALAASSAILSGDRVDLDRLRAENRAFYDDYIGAPDDQPAFKLMLDAYQDIQPRRLTGFESLKLTLRRLISKPKRAKPSAYLNHKFPDLTQSEVEKILSGILPQLNVESVRVTPAAEHCYLIETP